MKVPNRYAVQISNDGKNFKTLFTCKEEWRAKIKSKKIPGLYSRVLDKKTNTLIQFNYSKELVNE